MFARNMKILTMNTNTTSHIAHGGDGIEPITKVFNNFDNNGSEGDRVESGAQSVSSHKTNKREQKHNSKSKFLLNNNNIQQSITQEQQQKPQKYHHKNNNNNNNNAKQKSQHYNSKNSNSTLSANRKKYYQQHHQQQQLQSPHFQNQQQQQHYIAALQERIKSQINITINNNNSNLVANENYNIALHEQNYKQQQHQQQQHHQQHQQQQQQNINKNNNKVKDSTHLLETRSCLLDQINCNKPTMPFSSTECSSSIASLLPIAKSDLNCRNQHPHITIYDNHYKSALSSTSKTDLLNHQRTTAPSTSAKFSKLAEPQQLQSTTPLSKNNLNNLEEFVGNAVADSGASECILKRNFESTPSASPATSSPAAILATSTDDQLSNIVPHLVSENKLICKNSITSGGSRRAAIAVGEDNCRTITPPFYTVGEIIESTLLSSEKKEHYAPVKNLITNTSKAVGKSNRKKGNDAVLVSNVTTTQQKQLPKHQFPVEKNEAMTSSSVVTLTGSKSIKPAIPNCKRNTLLCPSKTTTISEEEPQLDKVEKLSNPKVEPKSFSNNNNSKNDIDKTTSAFSLKSTTSPQSSYSLDFLHSVGVKMTGLVLQTPETQGVTNGYGKQSECHPSVSNSFSGVTTNRKQPRHLFRGSNNSNGNTDSQHYNYHHQPSQLTIASFLHKDLLGDANLPANESNTDSNGVNFLSSSNSRNNNNCKDHQQRHYMQEQGLTRGPYHQNYYATSYQQPSGVIPNTNFGNEMGYNRELPSLLSNTSRGAQRNLRNGYLNFRNFNGESSMSKSHSKIDQRHPRHLKNSTGNYRNFVTNAQSKKQSYATSINSNASSSSSKFILSNSSNISSHKLRSMASSESNIATSKLNVTNETFSSKMLSISKERINHRGHPKHNSHHYSSHNNHFMTVSPNVLQHHNYCNLTYIATSGAADGATNIGYSSALQSQPTAPTSASANNCLNIKSQINSPSHVPVFMSFNPNHFQFTQYHHPQQLSAQQQQHLFHKFPHQQQQQQQPQNFLNKKIIGPLSLSIPSPTPSPKPIRRTANISIKSQLAMVPGNSIMSCYPFESYAAETPDAILPSEIVGGNDCDSDSCSNHSSTQVQYRSLTSVKSSVSTSPSISSLASNTSKSAQDVEQQSTYSQSLIPAATTPSRTPKDYIYTNPKSFSDVQVTQQASLKNFHTNNNGAVVSALNLPTKSQNIYTDEEYQQQLQQHHHRYFNAIANQRPADLLNISSALTAATNCSNNSTGSWSPSSHNNHFPYHQTNAVQVALIRSKTPSSSSGNSSISSISPPILQNDELQYTQQQPSVCISSNEQLGNIILDTGSKADSGMSSNSSSASSASFNGRRIKKNSTKGELTSKTDSSLLSAKQQLLIGPHICQSSSSNSSLHNLSDSTLTNAVQAFDEIVYLKENLMSTKNEYSNQFQQLPQISTSKSGSSSADGIQQLPPPPTPIQHILSFHQPQLHQSLPPPPASHNLLYNSPHTQHSRPLSSSIAPEFFTPPDRFLARAHLVEMKEAPSTLLNNSEWDRLSQDMWNKFIDSQQTKETFIQKMYLWRHLYLFIKNVYPRFGLYLVGSTISGFGSDSSDVDMCVVSRTASSIEPRLEALFNLTLLRDWLSKSGEFENFNLIEAKVPILRFSHRMHQLEIDLNFNNCVGIKNTHLLYCYSQLDWRVRPLVLIVKLWAQYHNINNAKNMTISSYSLVLMVIHFLQYSVHPPVLPCLHNMFPDKFPLLRSNDFGYVDMNETMRSYENENTLPLGELFSLFLEYYSFFDYTQFAISVRTGGVLPISECRAAKSPKNDFHQWKILCIEEPFDLTNTARSVYDYQTFERVKVVFMNSKRILKETLDLNSVFSNVMQSYCSLGSSSILNDPTATTDTYLNFQDQVTNTCENCGDQSKNYFVECNDNSTVDLNDANNDEIDDVTNRKLEQNKDSNYSLIASENKLFVQKKFLLCTKNNRSSNQTFAPMLS